MHSWQTSFSIVKHKTNSCNSALKCRICLSCFERLRIQEEETKISAGAGSPIGMKSPRPCPQTEFFFPHPTPSRDRPIPAISSLNVNYKMREDEIGGWAGLLMSHLPLMEERVLAAHQLLGSGPARSSRSCGGRWASPDDGEGQETGGCSRSSPAANGGAWTEPPAGLRWMQDGDGEGEGARARAEVEWSSPLTRSDSWPTNARDFEMPECRSKCAECLTKYIAFY